MYTTYALHSIENADEPGFCPKGYSRFKFGDDLVAEQFGVELAKGFIEKHLAVNPTVNQLVVISSPYSFIPTATFAMKNYFVFELNKWLAENNLPVIQETKIHRTITYKEDYGELDAEQRINLIGNDRFEIDKHFLQGKTLVFLDDIKITGSHERMIKRMVDDYGLTNDSYLLYFAELVNTDIHPRFENFLNYFSIKSIFDLENVIKNNRFAINTRIVKFILNSTPESFNTFISNQDIGFKNMLYNMALGNSYHTIEEYKTNLQTLKKYINQSIINQ